MGPVGGGLIHCGFFEGREAPLPFWSVEDLQVYMNKVRRCLSLSEYLPSYNILFGQGCKLLSDLDTDPEKLITIIVEPPVDLHSFQHARQQLWRRRVWKHSPVGLRPDRAIATIVCNVYYGIG